jgi:cytochrome d ubiquinol oxidase subunit I
VPALKEFPPEDRPNSTIVFWSFRVMVGLGMLMIFTGLWSLWLRKRGTLYSSRPFLYLALWMGPSGLIAILAGWFTTEIGRQPWVVYGLMRTADACPTIVMRRWHHPGDVRGGVLRAVRHRHRLHDAPGAQGPKTGEGEEPPGWPWPATHAGAAAVRRR